jgi:uncharacterized protein involved in outer membrane biogenesis
MSVHEDSDRDRTETLEFSVSLRDLPEKILVPRAALTRPDLVFERLQDDRKNWILAGPSDKSPSKSQLAWVKPPRRPCSIMKR